MRSSIGSIARRVSENNLVAQAKKIEDEGSFLKEERPSPRYINQYPNEQR